MIKAKMTTALGLALDRWTKDIDTKNLRVPVLLQLGGCSQAFELPRYAKRPDDIAQEVFLTAFKAYERSIGIDPDEAPQPIPEYNLREKKSTSLNKRPRSIPDARCAITRDSSTTS